MSEELVADPKFDAAMDRLAHEESLLMKPSKVLHAAADLLEKGWCQGALGQRENRHPLYSGIVTTDPVNVCAFRAGAEIDRLCLMGGLMKAVVDLYGEDWPTVAETYETRAYEDRTPIQRAMVSSYLRAEQVVARVATAENSIAVWNDADHRTQAEVVAVVRRAAVGEEGLGR